MAGEVLGAATAELVAMAAEMLDHGHESPGACRLAGGPAGTG